MLVTVAYFAAIVIAATAGGAWAGLTVFLLATAAVVGWILFSGKRERGPQLAPPRRHSVEERRILVVANETVGGTALRETIGQKTEGYSRAEVLVVCPALNTPVRHWASDEDPARRAAEERLRASLDRLAGAGIQARGEVGDSEPLQAIEDWLRLFDADEVIISTHPEGRSHWLEKGVVAEARERFAVPITHVIVDLEAERDEVR